LLENGIETDCEEDAWAAITNEFESLVNAVKEAYPKWPKKQINYTM
jgi:hypothetical protein